MSATVVPLPPNSTSETTDFLRRMASMVSGRNGEMLLRAAAMIDSLTHRATTAEQLYHRQHEDSTRNAELREVADLASDALMKQVEALRAELAESAADAATARAQFAAERARFEAERERLLGLMRDAEAHVAEVTAELETLKTSVDSFNETAVMVPIEVLRLARAQFESLSEGFAKKGDVISQVMSEIGACAIDHALASGGDAG
jgi:chromosome segregation ATPase